MQGAGYVVLVDIRTRCREPRPQGRLGASPEPGDISRMTDSTTDPQNAFGIWEGEVAAELPPRYDASLYYIGRIRTPWRHRKDCPKNARESDALCTLEIDSRWAPALKD